MGLGYIFFTIVHNRSVIVPNLYEHQRIYLGRNMSKVGKCRGTVVGHLGENLFHSKICNPSPPQHPHRPHPAPTIYDATTVNGNMLTIFCLF